MTAGTEGSGVVTRTVLRGVGVLWGVLMTIGDLCCYFFMIINRYMVLVNEHKPVNDFFHKVLLIGDGLAVGYGGFGQLGYPSGICRRLNLLYKREASIRTTWAFFERGVVGSSSEEWLPGGKYWTRTWNDRFCKDVELVVILVGLQDVMKGLTDTALPQLEGSEKSKKRTLAQLPLVENIEKIAREVKAMGKRVALCEIPMFAEEGSPKAKLIRVANEQLLQLSKTLDCPLTRASSRRLLKEDYRSHDGLHFSTSGYKILGQMMIEDLRAPLTNIEWAAFKEYISGKKVPPKRKTFVQKYFGWLGFGGSSSSSKQAPAQGVPSSPTGATDAALKKNQ